MLFPGGRLPLRLFEQRYLDMAKACLRDGSPFGVCLIREGREVGAPAVPADVGTTARIGDWDMPQLGMLHVVARGEARFRIVARRVEKNGLARGEVEMLPDDADAPVAADAARCARILERLLRETPGLAAEPHRLDSSSWVSLRLAELLPLALETKQALLEMSDGAARLAQLNAMLSRPAGS